MSSYIESLAERLSEEISTNQITQSKIKFLLLQFAEEIKRLSIEP